MADAVSSLLRRLGLAAGFLFLAVTCCRTAPQTDAFYVPPGNSGARLPSDGIYPQGRTMAFMGYSGEPARDLTNGFTVAGPVYGNQLPYLLRCESNGWPSVAHIGLRVSFIEKNSVRYELNEPELRRVIRKQMASLASFKQIAWWAVTPEELRPWRDDEMNYLRLVCEVIRENDPRRRPIYLYNPNHRDAAALVLVARWVDAVSKGCYVNTVGRKRDRAWVRWSVEQELAAIKSAGRTNAFALLNPELCKDPEGGEDGEIRAWVRHDVYLGLSSGAKGVVVWSLYPRKEAQRTWQLWYDAYAECGRELNGPLGLAQVFLFGERRSDLTVRLVQGESIMSVTLGGEAEPNTTSEQERAARKVAVPTWTAAEFAWGDSRWLFLINSANSPAGFVVSGWPAASSASNLFERVNIPLPESGALPLSLPPYGVMALRFQARPQGDMTRH